MNRNIIQGQRIIESADEVVELVDGQPVVGSKDLYVNGVVYLRSGTTLEEHTYLALERKIDRREVREKNLSIGTDGF
tara:strand:+ start:146 stop:376 length:231 start_codon:yes stop_codon:yes gene_type:complete